MKIKDELSYLPAKKVENWKTIEKIAQEMREFIKAGDYGKKAEEPYALHCSQMDCEEFNFFVINDKYLPIAMFESDVIVNPKMTHFNPKSVVRMTEGCMSFPYRKAKKVNRAAHIKVEYQVPDEKEKNGLRTIVRECDSVFAQVFQHEIQHGEGKNIYFDNPKI